jgi:hypothetical protein
MRYQTIKTELDTGRVLGCASDPFLVREGLATTRSLGWLGAIPGLKGETWGTHSSWQGPQPETWATRRMIHR